MSNSPLCRNSQRATICGLVLCAPLSKPWVENSKSPLGSRTDWSNWQILIEVSSLAAWLEDHGRVQFASAAIVAVLHHEATVLTCEATCFPPRSSEACR